MPTAITNDIKITVETAFQPQRVVNPDGDFTFAYRITIENHSEHTIKLLRRHWYIIDSVNDKTEVEGDGVVGLQPIIAPGESHQYVSGCALRSDIGKMFGTYTMERTNDGNMFDVDIPEFKLVAPFRLN
ncbi:MAG: Co2+/Mg2+ efflux protein ApaG [Bacteroidota bacterium]